MSSSLLGYGRFGSSPHGTNGLKSRFRDSSLEMLKIHQSASKLNTDNADFVDPRMAETIYVNLWSYDNNFNLDVNLEEGNDQLFDDEEELTFSQPTVKHFKPDYFNSKDTISYKNDSHEYMKAIQKTLDNNPSSRG